MSVYLRIYWIWSTCNSIDIVVFFIFVFLFFSIEKNLFILTRPALAIFNWHHFICARLCQTQIEMSTKSSKDFCACINIRFIRQSVAYLPVLAMFPTRTTFAIYSRKRAMFFTKLSFCDNYQVLKTRLIWSLGHLWLLPELTTLWPSQILKSL